MRKFVYYGSFASVVVDYFTNLFGVPDAAYSLRKLSPNSVYSGAAIRVRRSVGTPSEMDIPFVSSAPNAGIDTSALLSFVGAGNGFVTVWYDQSGNARNATNTTAADQPLIVNLGSVVVQDSMPTISFNGTSHRLLMANYLAKLSNFAIINLQKLNNTNNQIALAMMDASQAIYMPWISNAPNARWFYNSGNIYLQAPSSTNRKLAVMYAGGVNAFIKLNGVQEGSAAVGTATPVTQHVIGGFNGTTLRSNCNHQELIVYLTDKTSDISAIETNINNYYNVF
jgi:hypothetical protein